MHGPLAQSILASFAITPEPYTDDEWWEIIHPLNPSLTRETFDEIWREFHAAKRNREGH